MQERNSRGCSPPRAASRCSALIIAESAIFTIFVVAYVYNIGKSLYGPTPGQVLEVPLLQQHLPPLQQS